ncbi:hypothetical protein [Blastococcus sp. SYSU D00820]
MHPLLAAAARRRLGVFTATDLHRAGYDDDEIRTALRTRVWHRLRRGVYIETAKWERAVADPRSEHLVRSVAVLAVLGGRPALSHGSAARFHRLELPRGLDADVRLTEAAGWRRGRGYRVAEAALEAGEVARYGPLRVTSVARTLVDCGREWSLTDSVIALDSAVQNRLVTRAEVRAAVLRQTHWPAIGGAARALSLADGRAESPLETRGRLAILAAGLPLPEVQPEVYVGGRRLARLDGWYEEAAVAVEFDGRVKYTDDDALWDEKRREDAVRALGIRFLRVAFEDVVGGHATLVRRLRELLAVPYARPRDFVIVPTVEWGAGAADVVA